MDKNDILQRAADAYGQVVLLVRPTARRYGQEGRVVCIRDSKLGRTLDYGIKYPDGTQVYVQMEKVPGASYALKSS